MVAVGLVDGVLVSTTKDSIERSIFVASELISLAVRELESIKRFDNSVLPMGCKFDRRAFALVQGMYEDAALRIEALLDSITQFERRSSRIVPGAEDLRDAHGSLRAMLSISLDNIEQARRDVAEGRLTPMEEVRRELQPGVH